MQTETQQRHTFNTQRALVVWSFVAPTVLAFLASGTCFALYLQGRPVPSELGALAAAGSGYVFGSLPGFVRDYLKGGEA